jgi:hypothetical protein
MAVEQQSKNSLLTLLPEVACGAVTCWITVVVCWMIIAPNVDWPEWLFIGAPLSGAVIGAVLCALRIKRNFAPDGIGVLRSRAIRASAVLMLIGPLAGFVIGYILVPRGVARHFHWTAFSLVGFASGAILAVALAVVALLLNWREKGRGPFESPKSLDDKTPEVGP